MTWHVITNPWKRRWRCRGGHTSVQDGDTGDIIFLWCFSMTRPWRFFFLYYYFSEGNSWWKKVLVQTETNDNRVGGDIRDVAGLTLSCLGRSSARTRTPWLPGPAGRCWRHWCRCRQRAVETGSCRNTQVRVVLTHVGSFGGGGRLTRFSLSSSATEQSPAPSSSRGIYCSRWKRSPLNVSSCLRAH